MKRIASLKRQDIYEVSIGIGKDYNENGNEWINDGDADFGERTLVVLGVFSKLL